MLSRKFNVRIVVLCLLITVVSAVSACSNTAGTEDATSGSSLQNNGSTAESISTDESSSNEGIIKAENSTGLQNASCEESTGSVTLNDSILEQINSMTIEEKIGQLFIVGFKGKSANAEIISTIQRYHAGGVILFKNNIEDPDQLLDLTNSLKELNSKNSIPLFMSLDEEGGRISRMPEQIHKLPSNQEIGALNDSKLSFRIGQTLALELKAFGFNIDFAPVLDIFSNPQNTVIGDRAFGNGPGIVEKLGVQTMKGLQNGGVISVVKHFPGHGDTLVDSHVGLPTVEYDLARLESFEFKPFQAAVDNNADAVMIAHILLQKIDPEKPASMSKAVVTGILRDKIGFSQVVVTDDMTMGAVTENYTIGKAVVESVNAGCDIILVCHGYENQIAAYNAVKDAVKSGVITEDRLDESVGRILALKEKYKLKDTKISSVDVEKINKEIDQCLGN